jgi:hypothetical protein
LLGEVGVVGIGVMHTAAGRVGGSYTIRSQEPLPVRVTTVFKRLLRLDDVNVVDVKWIPRRIVVTVVLRRRRLLCPHCAFKTSAR